MLGMGRHPIGVMFSKFFMHELRRLIKTHRGLQIVLAVMILFSLFLLNQWQQERGKVVESTSSVVPALLELIAPPTVAPTETLRVLVNLDTKGAHINTVTADFVYPTELLELQEIQVQDSFVKIWFDKRTQDGKILLTGALPSPGFTGQGQIATIFFKVLQEGVAELAFSSNVAVFENGANENILGGSDGTEVVISPN